jgi:hypothetical protein
MWAFLKYVITQIALIRWILGSLGSLGILIPILALLKAIGLPVLIVLAIVAVPILIVLLVIGLPIFLVLICGAILLGIAWAFLTVGAVIIKPLLIVVLPMMVMGYCLWWLFSGRKRGTGEKPA